MYILKEAAKFYFIYTWINFMPIMYNFIVARLRNKKVLKKLENKWICITGATDGIGKALALNLAEKKINLIIVGRNQEKLESVKAEILKKENIKITTKVVDFSQPNNFNDFKNLEIDLLINNVGACSDGPKYFIEDSRMEEIVMVNIMNTFKLTQKVLQTMEKKKFGYVVNIGSITGDFPMPLLSTYASSKAMIKSWSENLHNEYLPYNINVELIDTGYVATKMSKIRNSSLFCPSADIYAKSIISHFGSGNITFSYFPHLILYFAMSCLPRDFLGKLVLYFQNRTRNFILKKTKNN